MPIILIQLSLPKKARPCSRPLGLGLRSVRMCQIQAMPNRSNFLACPCFSCATRTVIYGCLKISVATAVCNWCMKRKQLKGQFAAPIILGAIPPRVSWSPPRMWAARATTPIQALLKTISASMRCAAMFGAMWFSSTYLARRQSLPRCMPILSRVGRIRQPAIPRWGGQPV